jgi:hypothetical protein
MRERRSGIGRLAASDVRHREPRPRSLGLLDQSLPPLAGRGTAHFRAGVEPFELKLAETSHEREDAGALVSHGRGTAPGRRLLGAITADATMGVSPRS